MEKVARRKSRSRIPHKRTNDCAAVWYKLVLPLSKLYTTSIFHRLVINAKGVATERGSVLQLLYSYCLEHRLLFTSQYIHQASRSPDPEVSACLLVSGQANLF